MTRIASLAALCALLVACGSARRGPPFTPAPKLDAQEQLGERVFMKHCNQCHPEGEGGLGPAINNKPLPAFAIETQVRAGVGEMPSFNEETISEQELEAVSAYLVQLHSPRKEK